MLTKPERRQVRAQYIRLFGTPNPTRHDIVKYLFGPISPLFTLFRDRLKMDHKTFVDFMATNNTLSEGLSASQLYDMDFPTDLSGLMGKLEYTASWQKISIESVPESLSMSATSQKLFWEEVEEPVNKLLRALFIEGRSGKMINLVDDDKFHHESQPSKKKIYNIKIINTRGIIVGGWCRILCAARLSCFQSTFSPIGGNQSNSTILKCSFLDRLTETTR
jgi:hypothetical protein